MNGTTHSYRNNQNWRHNHVPVQKTHSHWPNWSWRPSHANKNERTIGFQFDTTKQNLPFPNGMVRSSSQRWASRRQLSLRILEARYPCRKRENSTRTPISSKRGHKRRCSKQARHAHDDKHAKDANRTAFQETTPTKKKLNTSRQHAYDASRSKVFQSMGFLISQWLEPVDVLKMKQTYKCTWKWGHCMRKYTEKANKTAKYMALLQNGTNPEKLIRLCKKRDVFDAIWCLPVEEIIQLAEKYKDYKTIRKLSYFF